MNRIRPLLASINVLNVLLLAAAVVAAATLVPPFFGTAVRVTLPPVGKTEIKTTALPAAAAQPAFVEYAAIGEKNLFHPERKIPPDKNGGKAALPKPELLLYGTLVADDLSIAYIEDKKNPYSTPGRGKRQKQLKKGDSIGGYVLRDVFPDRIVLAKGEENMVVMLADKEKRRGDGMAALPAAKAPSGLLSAPSAPSASSAPSAVSAPSAGTALLPSATAAGPALQTAPQTAAPPAEITPPAAITPPAGA